MGHGVRPILRSLRMRNLQKTRSRAKRGLGGIEPPTSPTLKENHTTRPMAHAPRSTESHIQLPAAPAHWLPRASSTAFRAPLAERSAVNRQVLGSIPSGGVPGGSSVVEQWTVKCSMQRSIGREFKSPSPECFSIFGLVGYDARFTRERSRVRFSEDVFLLFEKKKSKNAKKRGSSALEIPAWSPTAVLIELKGA